MKAHKYLREKLDDDGRPVAHTRIFQTVHLCVRCDLTGDPTLEFGDNDEEAYV